jgi:hypothetical protein
MRHSGYGCVARAPLDQACSRADSTQWGHVGTKPVEGWPMSPIAELPARGSRFEIGRTLGYNPEKIGFFHGDARFDP